MKNTILILAILFIGSPALFAGSNSIDPINSFADPIPVKKDSLVSLSYRLVKESVYFKLKMVNESKDGFYSMVREYGDGSFESVDIRQMTANTINTPLLYCFVDKEVPTMDFTYVLYRISDETNEVKRWNYCAETQEICPETSVQNILATH